MKSSLALLGSGRRKGAASRSRSPSSGSDTAKKLKLEKNTEVAAFIFRRDFRLVDNTALIALSKKASSVSLPILPLFFFNPVQCDKAKNPYFGDASFQFLCESLAELDQKEALDGRLVCLRGSDEECLHAIQRSGLQVRMVGYNEDFSPFAHVRDAELTKYCSAKQIEKVSSADDYTLLPLTAVLNKSEQPYSVFTSFCKSVLNEHLSEIRKPDSTALHVSKTFFKDGKAVLGKRHVDPLSMFTPMPHLGDHGGRTEGLARLAHLKDLKNYGEGRNDIPGDKTSHLSPHLKFGTVSIRETFARSVTSLGRSSGFIVQLVWRDFYAMLLYNHPRLAQAQLNAYPADVVASYAADNDAPKQKKGKRTSAVAKPKVNDPFLAKYYAYKWKWNEKHFEAFQQGRTGVPLVDAAVRCLNETGWCHNRCRMVIANFLVKVLGVDWREGERWFATVSVDFDVANNNGGWLWSSGQGADAQPYFRTFNPFRQSERFDPDSVFVHTWVEELREVPPSVIHKWDVYCERHKKTSTKSGKAAAPKRGGQSNPMNVVYETTYPAPIVNIKECTAKVVAEFKKYDPKK